eukprot:PhM_4_TR10254/c0_g1_i1/m.101692
MTNVLYQDRNSDSATLVAWTRQQRRWDKVASTIADKIGRAKEDVLITNSYAHRRRVEDINRIDLSVPSVVRMSNASWEMSLRGGGAGGTRYVPVGTSYPYPLYCPIPATEDMDPDHPAFMRVLSDDPHATKEHRLTQQPFYQQRYKEMSRFIKTKFSHVNPNTANEPFGLVGVPAPRTDHQPSELEDVEPIVLIPMQQQHPLSESSMADSNAGDTLPGITLPGQAARRPESTISPSEHTTGGATTTADGAATTLAATDQQQAAPTQPPQGPVLVMQASRLVFNTAPGQLSLASLRVDNVGTTAIYFQWRQLPKDPIVAGFHAQRPASSKSYFNLSDAMSGVLLPEDEKAFTFSFTHASPGIYTENWELLTVPSGVERIIITLRGVVVFEAEDAASRTRLSQKLDDRLPVEISRGVFTEILNAEHDNIIREAAKASEAREAQEAEQRVRVMYDEHHQAQKETFLQLNEALGVRYHDSAVVALTLLHKTVFEHLYGKLTPNSDETDNANNPSSSSLVRTASNVAGGAGKETPAADDSAADETNNKQTAADGEDGASSSLADDHDEANALATMAWDCSLRSLLELIMLLPDPVMRTSMTTAYETLVVAAGTVDDREDLPLSTLILTGYVRRALCTLCEDIAVNSIAMKENLGLLEAAPRGGKGKGDKPKPVQKKAPAKAAGGKSVMSALEDEPLPPQEEYAEAMPGMVRRALLDNLDIALTTAVSSQDSVEHVVQQPLTVSFSERLKEWALVAAQAKAEATKSAAPPVKKK